MYTRPLRYDMICHVTLRERTIHSQPLEQEFKHSLVHSFTRSEIETEINRIHGDAPFTRLSREPALRVNRWIDRYLYELNADRACRIATVRAYTQLTWSRGVNARVAGCLSTRELEKEIRCSILDTV